MSSTVKSYRYREERRISLFVLFVLWVLSSTHRLIHPLTHPLIPRIHRQFGEILSITYILHLHTSHISPTYLTYLLISYLQ